MRCRKLNTVAGISSDYGASVNMVNAMLNRIHLSGQADRLTERQIADVKADVVCYKALPVLPEGLDQVGDKWMWTDYRYENELYLPVWRPDSEEKRQLVTWQALDFAASRAEVLYPSGKGTEVTVTELGAEVTLPACFSAAVIRLWA